MKDGSSCGSGMYNIARVVHYFLLIWILQQNMLGADCNSMYFRLKIMNLHLDLDIFLSLFLPYYGEVMTIQL